MKRVFLILACALTLTLTSCAGFSSLNHNAVNQTEVVLQSNNYKIIKNVDGSTTSSYIFGIGGNTKQTMKDNAISAMFRNADLQNNQAVININYTVATRTILGIYLETKVTAYGTVIEFTR
ncbi:MAG: hypothetical protein K5650_00420 [Bacteroidales bacterium]|nr:hypothetical protein [Bacteroidales bacterium]